MPETPLVEFLARQLNRFGTKAEFARACELAESQVHRLFGGERPGLLVMLKVARCLGENPVRLLRLADAHEAADLLAHFVPESDRTAGPSSSRARVMAQRVAKLVERGLGPRLEEAVRNLEVPWQAGRPQFEETLQLCGAERGAMVLSHAGNPWDVVYSRGCSPDDLVSLREAPGPGWKMSQVEVSSVTARLYLHEPSRIPAARVNVYLHLAGATFAMFL